MSCDIHQSIQEINRSYLALVQRMLRDDRAEGMATLGLSAPLAELLVDLSEDQTQKLAARDQLICLFRFTDRALLGGLADRGLQLTPTAA
ncbi:flagellar transcriptional activator FlhD [Trinickia symbiotica]|uniref:Flagellar transcriptional activator FlhD n=1 Tax=Trinickia symbiotica TaxID=863227 RepID=A0A2T3XRK9_9BURK|nr:flagellar transcriptional regulator FlhD [Trinickia symbiotica]PTB19166.1 flagellar transcriptional activator FlhD [Trinickia symbiotica]